jgi:hypothetical protein
MQAVMTSLFDMIRDMIDPPVPARKIDHVTPVTPVTRKNYREQIANTRSESHPLYPDRFPLAASGCILRIED